MARTSSNALVIWTTAVLILALLQGSTATHYVVGGPFGWRVPTYNGPESFYQGWVESTFPYRTGDTLEFNYDSGDSVVLVNKEDFDACSVQHPIQLWTEGGPKAFEMVGHNIYYFISGDHGHCGAHQKFFIEVFK